MHQSHILVPFHISRWSPPYIYIHLLMHIYIETNVISNCDEWVYNKNIYHCNI